MCDNYVVNIESKPIAGVEGNPGLVRLNGKRKRQPAPRTRLSLTDFLGLLPGPPPLPASTANRFARILERSFERVERLKRLVAGKDYVVVPQRVHVPNLAKLDELEQELREFPRRRRLLTIPQFMVWADELRQMRRSVVGLAEEVRKSQHSDRQEAYLARFGRLFLEAPGDVLESFILNRPNKAGSNLHAVALARMRNHGLPRDKLAEWGRKGAAARWAKSRV
jgi:hypothetical protein